MRLSVPRSSRAVGSRRPRRLRLEALEDRNLPSVVAALSGTNLEVFLTTNDTATHDVQLQQHASQPTTETDVLDFGSLVGTFTNSAFNAIAVTLGPGNATVNLDNVLLPSSGISINEGSGNNTLIGPNAGAHWTVTGAGTGTIGNLISFTGVETLMGGGSNDQLTGPNQSTVFNVAGTNMGNLAVAGSGSYTMNFEAFPYLAGGSAPNTFEFIGDAFVSGSVNGGSSSKNTLDYSQAKYATTSSINFTNFATTQNLDLNGPETLSTSDGKVLRLVHAQTTPQSKNAFYNQLVSDMTFSTTFQFRIANPGGIKDASGKVGADGFVFILQDGSPANTGPATSGGGGHLGLDGRFPDSVGIAFDTFQNLSHHDSSSNELGIDLFGSVEHGSGNGNTTNVTPNFDNGSLWQAWITYDGTTLNIYASDTGTEPTTPTLSQQLNLSQIIGTPLAYAGFSAATWSGWETIDIRNWQFSSSAPVPNVPGILVDNATVTSPSANASGIGAGFAGIENFVGASGSNYLRDSGAWKITGMNTGTINSDSFSQFQNLLGTGKSSTFTFSTNAGLGGTLYTGNGNSTVTLASGATVAGLIEGGNGDNTLAGPSANAVWTLMGTNTGSLAVSWTTFTYQGFANLVGGKQNDAFRFVGDALVTGSLNGGAGANTLDYSQANYPTTDSINFGNFSSTAGLSLNGPTTQTTSDGAVLCLVGIHGGESHSAFANEMVSTENFSTTFQFRMTDPGGIKDPNGHIGADGFTFVLQNGSPATTGSGGSGDRLGLDGRFPDSVAIAFDTFENTTYHDSSSNELGIDLYGSVIHGSGNGATTNVIPAFDNGSLWQAWITYDGTTLNIYVSDTGTKPTTPTLSEPLSLPLIVGSPFAFAGFTASTGSGWQNVDIVNWQFSSNTVLPSNPGVLVDFHTLTRPTSNATGVGFGLSNIQSVIGSAGSNYLRDLGNWKITGSNSGTVNIHTFTSFQNLLGSIGADSFAIKAGGVLSGIINGGGGSDWLDYSTYGAPVTANLAQGTATGVNNGIGSIQNVIGSSAGNHLTGDAQGNILIGGSGADVISGGSGRSILIGGPGSDTITGGADEDIIIAGSTKFGANTEAALMAILTEWQRTDESYGTRISNIRTGVGSNHAYKLVWGSTVLDGGSSILQGNPTNQEGAFDWFFANLASGHDVIEDLAAGDTVN
jgi:hypothetical protein